MQSTFSFPFRSDGWGYLLLLWLNVRPEVHSSCMTCSPAAVIMSLLVDIELSVLLAATYSVVMLIPFRRGGVPPHFVSSYERVKRCEPNDVRIPSRST